MAFSWTYDAPTGVYKNHQLSENLRHAAIANTVAMQFVTPEPGYGKKMGESITITRVSNIAQPSNARISESQRIPEDTIVLSTVAITVSEWGRAVPYTSLSQDLGKFDPSSMIQRELRKQMALAMDGATADAMTSSSVKVKAIPDGVASLTFDTDGTASTQATVNLNVFHVETIRDYMFSTLHVPPYESDDYMSIVSTKAKRGLLRDPDWEVWHKYTDPQAKYNAELGRLENTRFIESGNTAAFSGSLGLNSVLGEAVFFGEDFCVMAVAQDPELRAEQNKGQDFGRQHAVAWYGILDFGVTWDTATAGEARGVHVTSS